MLELVGGWVMSVGASRVNVGDVVLLRGCQLEVTDTDRRANGAVRLGGESTVHIFAAEHVLSVIVGLHA